MRRRSKTTTYVKDSEDKKSKEVSALDEILGEVQSLKDENASLKNKLLTLYEVFLYEHSPFLIKKL